MLWWKNKTNKRGERIILALDSFQKPSVGSRQAIRTLGTLAKGMDLKIQPVSVISPDQLRWPKEFKETWREEFKKLGEKALTETVKKMKLSTDLPPEIVMQFTHSLSSSAKALTSFAEKSGAGAIAVLTHIQKKAPTAFPGGFVEALTSSSKLPVIAIHADAPAVTKVKTILVPTDFSEDSEKVFDLAMGSAKSFGAKIVLFHAMPSPMEEHWFSSASLVGGWERVEALLEEEEAQARATAKSWLERAAKDGVQGEFLFTHSSGTISDAILRAIKKTKTDLVVMAAQTGPLVAYLLGSVLRDVLRKSIVPVIIIRD